MSRMFALACAIVTLTLMLHRIELQQQQPHPQQEPVPAAPPKVPSSPPLPLQEDRKPRRTASGPTSSNATFWHVTDWHLNLFHKPHGDVRDMCRSEGEKAHWPGPLGHFNCDPSKAVAVLAVQRMVAAQPKPTFILLGGDSFGHVPAAQEDAAAVRESHRAMAELVGGAFPGVPVLPVVGNHDTWPYFSGGRAAREVRAELARLWGARLGADAAGDLERRGYYVARPAALAGLWLVALDTNALALADAAKTASRQLAWLEATLQAAEAARAAVLIVGHIAPGASHGDWNSIAAVGWAGGCWTVAAQRRFYAAIRAHRGVVRALLFGHLHSPSVRLLRPSPPAAAEGAAGAADAPMPVAYLSPSLTPRNPTPHQPAVRLYSLDGAAGGGGGEAGRWAVREAWDHAMDLEQSNARGAPAWSARSVREELGLRALDAAAWRAWLDALHDDGAFARYLGAQQCADEVEPEYATCKATALCAMGELEDAPYKACLRSVSAKARPPAGWVQAVKRKP